MTVHLAAVMRPPLAATTQILSLTIPSCAERHAAAIQRQKTGLPRRLVRTVTATMYFARMFLYGN